MPARPVVVVTNWVQPDVLDRLQRQCTVIANTTRQPWPAATLRQHAATADALIAFMPDRIDAAFLDAAPKLRLIACALKGYDNFDLAACTDRGVLVTIVEDLLTEPSAELTVGLMIALGRHVLQGDCGIRGEGFAGWRPRLYGTGLAGSTVGIIGMGAIGQSIARCLSGFRCKVLYHDTRELPPEQEAELGITRAELERELLPRSDYVVLALPLTPATHHLLDAARLARLKPGALLVNPARGSLVHEAAVADALASGQLGGYAADVFECEDWARADRPATVHPALLESDRTVFTPHLGSAVDAVRRRIAHAAADSVLAIVEGRQPPGCLNWPLAGVSRSA
jgi:phosphonate dehydrogenase